MTKHRDPSVISAALVRAEALRDAGQSYAGIAKSLSTKDDTWTEWQIRSLLNYHQSPSLQRTRHTKRIKPGCIA